MTKTEWQKVLERARDGKAVLCKCECGGNVRGVEEGNGRLFTWCDKCTPPESFSPPFATLYVRGEP